MPGFGVRITPAATKIFIAQARVRGRSRRVSIGAFPGKAPGDARREARATLPDMRAGLDPVAERAARAEALKARDVLLEDFADLWLAEYARPKLKAWTIRDYEGLIRQHVKPRQSRLAVSIYWRIREEGKTHPIDVALSGAVGREFRFGATTCAKFYREGTALYLRGKPRTGHTSQRPATSFAGAQKQACTVDHGSKPSPN